VGQDPVLSVATMARIAARADDNFNYKGWGAQLADISLKISDDALAKVSDAMTLAAWRAAQETGANAIVCLTRSGFTARSIARLRPECPIIAFSPDERTVHQLSLIWCVEGHLIEPLAIDAMVDRALELGRLRGDLRGGDLVAFLSGSENHQGLATDTLRLIRVPS
jgi:pyruvate kinase